MSMTDSKGNSGLPVQPRVTDTIEVIGNPGRPTTSVPIKPKPTTTALPSSEEIAAKQKQLRERLSKGQKSLDEVDRKQAALSAELDRTRQLNRELLAHRDQLQGEINQLKSEVGASNSQLIEVTSAHTQLQREQKALQTRYHALSEMNVGNFEYLEEIMAGVEELAAKAEKTAANASTAIEEQVDEGEPYNGADEG
jgi:chromosome segregation ATPase